MEKVFVVFVALFCCACEDSPRNKGEQPMTKFDYIKDDATGLCFAMTRVNLTSAVYGEGSSIAHVPCEKVEKFIK